MLNSRAFAISILVAVLLFSLVDSHALRGRSLGLRQLDDNSTNGQSNTAGSNNQNPSPSSGSQTQSSGNGGQSPSPSSGSPTQSSGNGGQSTSGSNGTQNQSEGSNNSGNNNIDSGNGGQPTSGSNGNQNQFGGNSNSGNNNTNLGDSNTQTWGSNLNGTNSNNGGDQKVGLGPEPQVKTGHATHFEKFGEPYGGCGVPQKYLDSEYFVALNVVATPKYYDGPIPRPLVGNDIAKKGAWDQGRNCGRWIKVTLQDDCKGGINSGEQNKPFCNGGTYGADDANGATLNMLIGDSCGDGNAWCRDDPYHVDLADAATNKFSKDGNVLSLSKDWRNRKVSWEYIKAPDYQGDIKIYFMKDSDDHWTSVGITHLPNGIHAVEFYQDNQWKKAGMNSDMGQAYLISPVSSDNRKDFKIRVTDADDQLVYGGREYSFTNPCNGKCSGDFLLAEMTTSGGSSQPYVDTPGNSQSGSSSSSGNSGANGATPTGSGANGGVGDSPTTSNGPDDDCMEDVPEDEVDCEEEEDEVDCEEEEDEVDCEEEEDEVDCEEEEDEVDCEDDMGDGSYNQTIIIDNSITINNTWINTQIITGGGSGTGSGNAGSNSGNAGSNSGNSPTQAPSAGPTPDTLVDATAGPTTTTSNGNGSGAPAPSGTAGGNPGPSPINSGSSGQGSPAPAPSVGASGSSNGNGNGSPAPSGTSVPSPSNSGSSGQNSPAPGTWANGPDPGSTVITPTLVDASAGPAPGSSSSGSSAPAPSGVTWSNPAQSSPSQAVQPGPTPSGVTTGDPSSGSISPANPLQSNPPSNLTPAITTPTTTNVGDNSNEMPCRVVYIVGPPPPGVYVATITDKSSYFTTTTTNTNSGSTSVNRATIGGSVPAAPTTASVSSPARSS